jgi:hypothetical protein
MFSLPLLQEIKIMRSKKLGYAIECCTLSNKDVSGVRYIGPRHLRYDGDFYCFGFWYFHVYLTNSPHALYTIEEIKESIKRNEIRENLVKSLKGVFYETQGAAYYGGTLSWGDTDFVIGVNVDGKGFLVVDGKEETFSLSIIEQYWTCKNYLKYKTPEHSGWEQAQLMVNGE